MSWRERALAFRCRGDWLYGIASVPELPAPRGVLIVVGGPQTRTGSHRQFTLLARHLAAHGVAAFRFDYRGMGDSDGLPRSFEHAGDDIAAAIDRFRMEVPQVREVALWGLCDGATAAAFHAPRDPRVTGIALLNPWVRTGEGAARTLLRHYYLRRLFARELWTKVLRGRVDARGALRDLGGMLGAGWRARPAVPAGSAALEAAARPAATPASLPASLPLPAATLAQDGTPLPERLRQSLAQFDGRLLFILSGNDLVAQEFRGVANSSRAWRRLMSAPRVRLHELPEASHTFAAARWRDQVADWTLAWVRSW